MQFLFLNILNYNDSFIFFYFNRRKRKRRHKEKYINARGINKLYLYLIQRFLLCVLCIFSIFFLYVLLHILIIFEKTQ